MKQAVDEASSRSRTQSMTHADGAAKALTTSTRTQTVKETLITVIILSPQAATYQHTNMQVALLSSSVC